MNRSGIGYRITIALVITALLTTALSVFLFYFLTGRAFNDYVKENTAQLGWELVDILGDIYQKGGWPGVRSFLAEASTMRGHHGMMMNPEMGRRGMGTMMSLLQRQMMVTDIKGNVMASSRGLRVTGPLPKALWDMRVPIFSDGVRVGFLMILTPESPYENSLEYVFTKTISQYSYWALFFSLIIALGVGLFVSPKLVKPIKELSQGVRRFAQGERDIAFSTKSEDELGALAEDFVAMAEKIKTGENLRKNLTADVAHELRTPLSILRGTLESIQDDVIEPTPEVMLSMQDEILRMSRLVKDLSDLSQAEAGNLELFRELVSPSALKDKFSCFKAEAELKGVNFVVDIPEVLPMIPMDVIRITQVISNLLDNSLRHTTAGEIALTATEVKGGIEFSISDTGRGIKAEDLPNVFERFYREEKSRSRKTGGMGLGLSIAKGLVEAHEGKMWVTSEEGKGAKFTFFLPA